MAPVVPRIEQQVEQRGLPNVRVNTEAPIEAFGGGAPLNRVQTAMESGFKAIDDFFRNEKKKASDVKLQDKFALIEGQVTNTLYERDKGAYWQKGKNAFGLVESHYSPLEKFATDLESDLDDEEKALYRRRVNSILGQTREGIMRHVGAQVGAYDKESTDNYIAALKDRASRDWLNPRSAEHAIASITTAVQKEAERTGINDAASINERARKEIGEALLARFSTQAAMGAPERALEDLAKYGAYIPPQDAAKVQKTLKEMQGEKDGRALGESFMASEPSPAAAMAKAQLLEDKTARAAAVERIKEIAKNQDEEKEQRRSQALEQAFQFIDKTKGREEVPPALFARLSPEDKTKTLNYKKKFLDGREEETDPKALEELTELAKNGKLAKMSSAEYFTQFHGRLGGKWQTKGYNMFLNSRDPRAEKQAQFKSTLSTDDMIRNVMISSGLLEKNVTPAKMTPEQAKRKQVIEDALEERMKAYFYENNKNAPDDLKQKFLNDIVRQRVMFKQSYLGVDAFASDKEVPLGSLSQDELDRVYVKFDQIPQHEVTRMVNLMRARGAIPAGMSDEAARTKYRDRLERAWGKLLTDRQLGIKNLDNIMTILRGED